MENGTHTFKVNFPIKTNRKYLNFWQTESGTNNFLISNYGIISKICGKL